MAGIAGNNAWLMGAKQTAKGAPATIALATTFKTPFSGGNIQPVPTFDRLAETDSSRDRGIAYKVTSGIEGSPENYVRDKPIGLYLLGAFGTDVVTGTTPNFTHTFTPATAIPYLTLWRSLGSVLWERYDDCYINTLRIHADAGRPLEAVISVQGLRSTRLTTDPSTALSVPLESGYVYNYNDGTVQLSGGATATIGSFDLTIDNNVVRQQTDNVEAYDVFAQTREVSLSFDLIFDSLDEYNKYHYGSVAGTTTASTIYTTSAQFDFVQNGGAFSSATNGLSFVVPSLSYEEFSVAPDAAGAPIRPTIRAVAQRSASPVVTAIVKNQQASY